jgi:hypothetical protein
LLIGVLMVFGLVAGCAQQVGGTALPVAGDAPKRTSSRPPLPTGRPSGTTTSSARPSLDGVAGNWEGTYTCAQGETGLKLQVQPPDAVFEFYPVAANPAAKAGKYKMKVAYSAGGQITFTQVEWIDQPEGYGMVDLVVAGKPTGDTMTGRVLSDACQNFSVTRK